MEVKNGMPLSLGYNPDRFGITKFFFVFDDIIHPYFLEDFEIIKEPPYYYSDSKTNEPFYFTHSGLYIPKIDYRRFLPFPVKTTSCSKTKQSRVYPLAVTTEKEEATIFINHILWIRHRIPLLDEAEQGLYEFLNYQCSQNIEGHLNFLNRIESIVFDPDLVVSANLEDIECFECVKNWIHENREYLRGKLGKYYPQNDGGEIAKGENYPREQSSNSKKKNTLNAAQYIIIEYLKNGKKLNPRGLTQGSYIAKLAGLYPASEAALKEQLKRRGEARPNICPYLTLDLTEGQGETAIGNYEAVLEYFQNENNIELSKGVELILNRLYLTFRGSP